MIIVEWVGEKRKNAEKRGSRVILVNISAIPAMGYIPETGFTSGGHGIEDKFPLIHADQYVQRSQETRQLKREATCILIQEVYPSSLRASPAPGSGLRLCRRYL